MPTLPTAQDVADAHRLIRGVLNSTPLVSSAELDAITGARVFLKPESLQRTGSFKFRGAYNRLARITGPEKSAGVVAMSSGNHAQGVATAAKMLGLRATIVMPKDSPAMKRDRTAAAGAEVVLYDRGREDRVAIARGIAEERGATLVPPYDDFHIIAGQGTAGREIMDELEARDLTPDSVLVCCSGGGLLAGIALAVKERAPKARIYSVEPEGFDDHARSLAEGHKVVNVKKVGSICDGLLADTPGDLTFAINRNLVTGGVVVTEDEVRNAVAFAFRELKLVVEPSGAVPLAALLAGRLDVKGQVVAAMISGGNVDPELFASIVG
ncbi:MAG: threonine/serine dehydratase [Alphaproteobacteria bacterium]|jgi:threonine dehydratase